MNSSLTKDAAAAAVTRGAMSIDQMIVDGHYTVECTNPDGSVKWTEEFDNLVTTQGKDHLLNHGLAGPATAVNARMSFIASGTPVIGDTYATHVGFVEVAVGVIAARGTPAWAASSGGVKQTSSAVSAAIIGTGTVTGIAINLIVGAVSNLGVVGDTATGTAILYSAGTFGVSKSVSSGDTLNVTYSTTLS